MIISPNQRNKLYKTVEAYNLAVRDFNVTEAENILIVTHKSSGARFRVVRAEVRGHGVPVFHLFAYFTPFVQGDIFNIQKEQSNSGSDSFEKLLLIFKNWIGIIKSEYSVPDLWSEMENTPHMFASNKFNEGEIFTEHEIKLLENRLPEIEGRIRSFNLPPDAECEIIEVIHEAPRRALLFDKQTFEANLIGSLVKIGFKWKLTTNDMNAVWFACKKFFTLTLS